MRKVVVGASAAIASLCANADVTGFAQLHQARRVHALPECMGLDACTSMVQDARAELLLERSLGKGLAGTARLQAAYDHALSEGKLTVREAFLDWQPARGLDLKLGRQVLTWGVSDYLYVNDVFPKNYDAFFSGGGFDRMKEPVDAVRAAGRVGTADVEVVVARSTADTGPSPLRFAAAVGSKSSLAADDADDRADLAAKASAHLGGWDVAAYVASFRSREQRYFMNVGGLRHDRPRTRHAGLSLTGNLASGLVWAEAAVRHASQARQSVVSRHFYGTAAKFIAGYSRELGSDLTASAQLQLESPLDRSDYLMSLAPGVRPLSRIASTLHLRVQGRWLNQTVSAGVQVFLGHERDSHVNPFVSWSPADGWTVEGGANLFNGQPDTRYGAFKDDSNVYVLGRYSF